MPSFWSLLVIIGMTLYFSFMYESPAIMLLAAMEAAFFVLSVVCLLYYRVTIYATLDVPIDISEPGKENLVQIKIDNKSGMRIARMEARLIVKDGIRRKKGKYDMRLSDIPKGESCMIRNVIFSRAGKYTIALKKIRIYDRTGLLFLTIRPWKIRYVNVAPPYYDVPVQLTMATKNFYGEADVYDEKLPGYDNSETFQVRTYQKGDRLQNVHWKLTAKQDELMVKENALPNCCPVILFLDYNPKGWGRRCHNVLPYIEAAASLSFSMMDAGCPHYVAWYDGVQKDVVRIRVDNEESMFRFLGMLMRIEWEKSKEELKQRYKEKYSREPYVFALSLNQKLILKKEDEVLAKLSPKKMEKSLAHTELLL